MPRRDRPFRRGVTARGGHPLDPLDPDLLEDRPAVVPPGSRVDARLGVLHVPRLAVGTGFCGACTTFSTFAYEALRLGEKSQPRQGVAYVVGSVLACLLGAGAGLALASIGWRGLLSRR